MAKEHTTRVGFAGFPAPESNTTYTPNQFFDVLLKHSKNRGEVRFVAYLMRKTLGWCDANGEPQETEIYCSHRELIEKAGISRGAISQAIEDAVAHGFVECVREGSPNLSGRQAVTSLYRLRFAEDDYTTKLEEFSGFFEGEGNRTFIPNVFFDLLVPAESLAVVKVVGAIIRHTIGWRNKYGFRRQKVALSLRQLERLTGLAKRATREAVKTALDAQYIRKVGQGFFDPTSNQKNEPNTYAIFWEDSEEFDMKGSEEPENKALEGDGSKKTLGGEIGTVQKRPPTKQSKKDPRTVQKSPPERFKKDPRIKRTPNKRKPIETTQSPEGSKKGDVALLNSLFDELKKRGVSGAQAKKLSAEFDSGAIEIQLEAFDWRVENGQEFPNPGGFLREAIVNDWSVPKGFLPKAEREKLEAEKEQRLEAARKRKEAQKQREAEEEAAAAEAAEKREKQAEEYLAGLPDAERERLIEEAVKPFPALEGAFRTALIANHVAELLESSP